MPTFDPQIKQIGALHIVMELLRHGFQALFAGGVVRDMVMGNNQIGDIDIATNATPQTISQIFPHTIKVGEQFGVMVVVEHGIPFEVATFRSDIGIADGRHPAGVVYTDARQDALRRDFTINGLFFDPISEKLIDYVCGLKDIEQKVIRAIGDPELRFKEDYLRMLRAIRFAARFSFKIEEKTWNGIKKYGSEIVNISAERIFLEIDKILRQPHADQAILLLKECGLLQIILPEVADLIGVEQPQQFHPEGDVFTHTVLALGLLKSDSSQVLAWSVLLHDIGKPSTKTISDRIRFNNHDRVGGAMARELLKRLRASNNHIKEVEACIENHMNFKNVKQMRLATLKKLLSRETIDEELELHRIDCLASHGNLENYYYLVEKRSEIAADKLKPQPYIKGKDLIDFGLKPGPQFGEILSEIYDLQLEEKINSREQALEMMRQKISLSQ
ncbi:MAG TPA: CCA tRNA nucleotidyltransferase [Chitinispirillaceae bacterium]|nr:CCA tRNA nucleotidyltransferase [Chitinispirillaceae bacterium]